MTELIGFLSTGKGSWSIVSKIVGKDVWDKIFLLTNDFGKEKFSPNEKTELITIDMGKNSVELRDEIKAKLKPRIKGTEIAINITSGSGKEHTALISALLQLGFAIRLIDLVNNEIEEV